MFAAARLPIADCAVLGTALRTTLIVGSEATLGRRNAGGARIDLHRHAQRAAEGLERRLRLMVGVVAPNGVDMQRHAGVIDQSLEELAHQVHIEVADRGAHERQRENQSRSPGQIDHHARQRLVERYVGMAVAANALLVADGSGQRLAERNADVLDRMVGVDVQVAGGRNLQIDHAVPGYLVEHVVEETDPGGDPRTAPAIEIELHPNLSLERVALNFGAAHQCDSIDEKDEAHDTISCRFQAFYKFPFRPMNRYWSQVAKSLTPYVPGEQPKLANLVKLNTNENPYGPSPKVLAAIHAETGDTLRLYPDPLASRLRAAIAAYHGQIEARQVFVGNGSDEVLAHVFLALLKHEQPILFPDISYSFYPVYANLYQITYETVPLSAQFEIRAGDYLRPNGGIVIANPNAPTGRALPASEIERIVAGNPDSVVVIDEAYVDFGAESVVPLVNKYPNLLVVHTLSKARSLAGLRVGFAVGHADLIEALERVKDSFNSYPLDRLAQAGATAAIEDREWFERTRQAVMRSRAHLTADLTALGFAVLPSSANFVFARHPGRDGGELAQALRQRSIIVRHFKLPRIDQFLRITIGTDEQCMGLVTALRELLEGPQATASTEDT